MNRISPINQNMVFNKTQVKKSKTNFSAFRREAQDQVSFSGNNKTSKSNKFNQFINNIINNNKNAISFKGKIKSEADLEGAKIQDKASSILLESKKLPEIKNNNLKEVVPLILEGNTNKFANMIDESGNVVRFMNVTPRKMAMEEFDGNTTRRTEFNPRTLTVHTIYTDYEKTENGGFKAKEKFNLANGKYWTYALNYTEQANGRYCSDKEFDFKSEQLEGYRSEVKESSIGTYKVSEQYFFDDEELESYVKNRTEAPNGCSKIEEQYNFDKNGVSGYKKGETISSEGNLNISEQYYTGANGQFVRLI